MVKTITKSPLHDVIQQQAYISTDESPLGHPSSTTSRVILGSGGGPDVIGGTNDDDDIYVYDGGSTVWGQDGSDYLVADSGNNTFFGGEGDDLVFMRGNGNDRLMAIMARTISMPGITRIMSTAAVTTTNYMANAAMIRSGAD